MHNGLDDLRTNTCFLTGALFLSKLRSAVNYFVYSKTELLLHLTQKFSSLLTKRAKTGSVTWYLDFTEPTYAKKIQE